jgi:hypothetical protein
MIGMAVRDQRAGNGTKWIDMEVAGGAIEACRRGGKEV